jgi:hypothetical protein
MYMGNHFVVYGRTVRQWHQFDGGRFEAFFGDEALFILGLVGPLYSMGSTVHSCNQPFNN